MTVVDVEPHKKPLLRRLLDYLILRRVWYVYTPVVLVVSATPQACLKTLIETAKPSAQRLQHRNLFAQGRRYFIRPLQDGFRLTTTHSVRWRYRKRTSSVTVMRGKMELVDKDTTRVQLRARINAGYLLDTFLVPGFITSILVYVPWEPFIIAAALIPLYVFSWIGHRSNAVLEAAEMVWFVQKALDELMPTQALRLEAATDQNTVDVNQDFAREWDRFYDQHKDDA